MGKYIDWYLVEVEQRLKDRLHPHDLIATLNEIELHLRSDAEALRELELEPLQAEKAAISSFGPPESFVSSFCELQRAKFQGLMQGLALLAAALCLLLGLSSLYVGQASIFFVVASYASGLLLLPFAAFSFLGRKFLWKHLLAASVAPGCAAFLMWGTLYVTGDYNLFRREELHTFHSAVRSALAQTKKSEAAYQRDLASFKKDATVPMKEGRYLAPGIQYTYRHRPEIVSSWLYQPQPTQSLEEATRFWADEVRFQSIANQVASAQDYHSAQIREVQAAIAKGSSFDYTTAWMALGSMAGAAAGLTLINGLFAGLGQLAFRRRVNRRPRLA